MCLVNVCVYIISVSIHNVQQMIQLFHIFYIIIVIPFDHLWLISQNLYFFNDCVLTCQDFQLKTMVHGKQLEHCTRIFMYIRHG